MDDDSRECYPYAFLLELGEVMDVKTEAAAEQMSKGIAL
ncbi:hypothetical protein BXY39_3097 [Eilatimonas milleporae]|uniref:Uncharacterized protein n=1 Tax=Eilatimonas milleporae TaxID=911205 RepID=A0A3M0C7H1_9PROT|nr:hypothetical protein BXY39_3097 [Eilatimonas milleporae]